MFINYDREKAVQYAIKHALTPNTDFYYFGGIGGDCTNFVSQSLLAGCDVMNYTPTFGWYYNHLNDRTPSWTGVEFLQDFLLNNQTQGPFAEICKREELELGDIVQLNQRGYFNHSAIVTKIENNTIFVSAHSNDVLNIPLENYYYREILYLHILGARK